MKSSSPFTLSRKQIRCAAKVNGTHVLIVQRSLTSSGRTWLVGATQRLSQQALQKHSYADTPTPPPSGSNTHIHTQTTPLCPQGGECPEGLGERWYSRQACWHLILVFHLFREVAHYRGPPWAAAQKSKRKKTPMKLWLNWRFYHKKTECVVFIFKDFNLSAWCPLFWNVLRTLSCVLEHSFTTRQMFNFLIAAWPTCMDLKSKSSSDRQL